MRQFHAETFKAALFYATAKSNPIRIRYGILSAKALSRQSRAGFPSGGRQSLR